MRADYHHVQAHSSHQGRSHNYVVFVERSGYFHGEKDRAKFACGGIDMLKGRRSFLSSSLATLPIAGAVARSATAAEREPQSLKQRLVAAFDALEIADTHEHLLDEKERCAQNIDFFRLIGHYALGDAICAGMTRD